MINTDLIPTQQEPLRGDEEGSLLPPGHPDQYMSLQALLERSRGISIPTLEGSGVRLSRFTQKQISRAHRVKPGTRRKGKHLRKIVRRRHPLSTRRVKREWQREYHRSPRRKFWELRKKKGHEQWLITEEEWAEIWDLLGTHSFEVRRYEDDKPFTKYNIYIYDKSGKKLYEGAEEALRDIGALL